MLSFNQILINQKLNLYNTSMNNFIFLRTKSKNVLLQFFTIWIWNLKKSLTFFKCIIHYSSLSKTRGKMYILLYIPLRMIYPGGGLIQHRILILYYSNFQVWQQYFNYSKQYIWLIKKIKFISYLNISIRLHSIISISNEKQVAVLVRGNFNNHFSLF